MSADQDEGSWARRPTARIKGFARSMRHAPAEAEAKLWRLLRDPRLVGHTFRRQDPLGHYIVDFACFDSRLIVELDGSRHFKSPTDPTRDAWLEDQGFRLLRLWNSDANPDAVLTTILAIQEPTHDLHH